MYNGRALLVQLDDTGTPTTIAAIQSKTLTHNRAPVDVTTDDDDGWRRLLPDPASRSIDASIEGVVTDVNFENIISEWEGNVFSDITIQYPNGDTATAEDGFFLGNVEISGEQDGHVAFTAELQSSGPVTRTPAP